MGAKTSKSGSYDFQRFEKKAVTKVERATKTVSFTNLTEAQIYEDIPTSTSKTSTTYLNNTLNRPNSIAIMEDNSYYEIPASVSKNEYLNKKSASAENFISTTYNYTNEGTFETIPTTNKSEETCSSTSLEYVNDEPKQESLNDHSKLVSSKNEENLYQYTLSETKSNLTTQIETDINSNEELLSFQPHQDQIYHRVRRNTYPMTLLESQMVDFQQTQSHPTSATYKEENDRNITTDLNKTQVQHSENNSTSSGMSEIIFKDSNSKQAYYGYDEEFDPCSIYDFITSSEVLPPEQIQQVNAWLAKAQAECYARQRKRRFNSRLINYRKDDDDCYATITDSSIYSSRSKDRPNRVTFSDTIVQEEYVDRSDSDNAKRILHLQPRVRRTVDNLNSSSSESESGRGYRNKMTIHDRSGDINSELDGYKSSEEESDDSEDKQKKLKESEYRTSNLLFASNVIPAESIEYLRSAYQERMKANAEEQNKDLHVISESDEEYEKSCNTSDFKIGAKVELSDTATDFKDFDEEYPSLSKILNENNQSKHSNIDIHDLETKMKSSFAEFEDLCQSGNVEFDSFDRFLLNDHDLNKKVMVTDLDDYSSGLPTTLGYNKLPESNTQDGFQPVLREISSQEALEDTKGWQIHDQQVWQPVTASRRDMWKEEIDNSADGRMNEDNEEFTRQYWTRALGSRETKTITTTISPVRRSVEVWDFDDQFRKNNMAEEEIEESSSQGITTVYRTVYRTKSYQLLPSHETLEDEDVDDMLDHNQWNYIIKFLRKERKDTERNTFLAPKKAVVLIKYKPVVALRTKKINSKDGGNIRHVWNCITTFIENERRHSDLYNASSIASGTRIDERVSLTFVKKHLRSAEERLAQRAETRVLETTSYEQLNEPPTPSSSSLHDWKYIEIFIENERYYSTICNVFIQKHKSEQMYLTLVKKHLDLLDRRLEKEKEAIGHKDSSIQIDYDVAADIKNRVTVSTRILKQNGDEELLENRPVFDWNYITKFIENERNYSKMWTTPYIVPRRRENETISATVVQKHLLAPEKRIEQTTETVQVHQNTLTQTDSHRMVLEIRNQLVMPPGLEFSESHPIQDWNYITTFIDNERKYSEAWASYNINPQESRNEKVSLVVVEERLDSPLERFKSEYETIITQHKTLLEIRNKFLVSTHTKEGDDGPDISEGHVTQDWNYITEFIENERKYSEMCSVFAIEQKSVEGRIKKENVFLELERLKPRQEASKGYNPFIQTDVTGSTKKVTEKEFLVSTAHGKNYNPFVTPDWNYITEFIKNEIKECETQNSYHYEFKQRHATYITVSVVKEVKRQINSASHQMKELSKNVEDGFLQSSSTIQPTNLDANTIVEFERSILTPDWSYITRFIQKEKETMEKENICKPSWLGVIGESSLKKQEWEAIETEKQSSIASTVAEAVNLLKLKPSGQEDLLNKAQPLPNETEINIELNWKHIMEFIINERKHTEQFYISNNLQQIGGTGIDKAGLDIAVNQDIKENVKKSKLLKFFKLFRFGKTKDRVEDEPVIYDWSFNTDFIEAEKEQLEKENAFNFSREYTSSVYPIIVYKYEEIATTDNRLSESHSFKEVPITVEEKQTAAVVKVPIDTVGLASKPSEDTGEPIHQDWSYVVDFIDNERRAVENQLRSSITFVKRHKTEMEREVVLTTQTIHSLELINQDLAAAEQKETNSDLEILREQIVEFINNEREHSEGQYTLIITKVSISTVVGKDYNPFVAPDWSYITEFIKKEIKLCEIENRYQHEFKRRQETIITIAVTKEVKREINDISLQMRDISKIVESGFVQSVPIIQSTNLDGNTIVKLEHSKATPDWSYVTRFIEKEKEIIEKENMYKSSWLGLIGEESLKKQEWQVIGSEKQSSIISTVVEAVNILKLKPSGQDDLFNSALPPPNETNTNTELNCKQIMEFIINERKHTEVLYIPRATYISDDLHQIYAAGVDKAGLGIAISQDIKENVKKSKLLKFFRLFRFTKTKHQDEEEPVIYDWSFNTDFIEAEKEQLEKENAFNFSREYTSPIYPAVVFKYEKIMATNNRLPERQTEEVPIILEEKQTTIAVETATDTFGPVSKPSQDTEEPLHQDWSYVTDFIDSEREEVENQLKSSLMFVKGHKTEIERELVLTTQTIHSLELINPDLAAAEQKETNSDLEILREQIVEFINNERKHSEEQYTLIITKVSISTVVGKGYNPFVAPDWSYITEFIKKEIKQCEIDYRYQHEFKRRQETIITIAVTKEVKRETNDISLQMKEISKVVESGFVQGGSLIQSTDLDSNTIVRLKHSKTTPDWSYVTRFIEKEKEIIEKGNIYKSGWLEVIGENKWKKQEWQRIETEKQNSIVSTVVEAVNLFKPSGQDNVLSPAATQLKETNANAELTWKYIIEFIVNERKHTEELYVPTVYVGYKISHDLPQIVTVDTDKTSLDDSINHDTKENVKKSKLLKFFRLFRFRKSKDRIENEPVEYDWSFNADFIETEREQLEKEKAFGFSIEYTASIYPVTIYKYEEIKVTGNELPEEKQTTIVVETPTDITDTNKEPILQDWSYVTNFIDNERRDVEDQLRFSSVFVQQKKEIEREIILVTETIHSLELINQGHVVNLVPAKAEETNINVEIHWEKVTDFINNERIHTEEQYTFVPTKVSKIFEEVHQTEFTNTTEHKPTIHSRQEVKKEVSKIEVSVSTSSGAFNSVSKPIMGDAEVTYRDWSYITFFIDNEKQDTERQGKFVLVKLKIDNICAQSESLATPTITERPVLKLEDWNCVTAFIENERQHAIEGGNWFWYMKWLKKYDWNHTKLTEVKKDKTSHISLNVQTIDASVSSGDWNYGVEFVDNRRKEENQQELIHRDKSYITNFIETEKAYWEDYNIRVIPYHYLEGALELTENQEQTPEERDKFKFNLKNPFTKIVALAKALTTKKYPVSPPQAKDGVNVNQELIHNDWGYIKEFIETEKEESEKENRFRIFIKLHSNNTEERSRPTTEQITILEKISVQTKIPVLRTESKQQSGLESTFEPDFTYVNKFIEKERNNCEEDNRLRFSSTGLLFHQEDIPKIESSTSNNVQDVVSKVRHIHKVVSVLPSQPQKGSSILEDNLIPTDFSYITAFIENEREESAKVYLIPICPTAVIYKQTAEATQQHHDLRFTCFPQSINHENTLLSTHTPEQIQNTVERELNSIPTTSVLDQAYVLASSTSEKEQDWSYISEFIDKEKEESSRHQFYVIAAYELDYRISLEEELLRNGNEPEEHRKNRLSKISSILSRLKRIKGSFTLKEPTPHSESGRWRHITEDEVSQNASCVDQFLQNERKSSGKGYLPTVNVLENTRNSGSVEELSISKSQHTRTIEEQKSISSSVTEVIKLTRPAVLLSKPETENILEQKSAIQDWSYITEFIEKEKEESAKLYSFIQLKSSTHAKKGSGNVGASATGILKQTVDTKISFILTKPTIQLPELKIEKITSKQEVSLQDWNYITKFIEMEREESAKQYSYILSSKVNVLTSKIMDIKELLRIQRIVATKPQETIDKSKLKEEFVPQDWSYVKDFIEKEKDHSFNVNMGRISVSISRVEHVANKKETDELQANIEAAFTLVKPKLPFLELKKEPSAPEDKVTVQDLNYITEFIENEKSESAKYCSLTVLEKYVPQSGEYVEDQKPITNVVGQEANQPASSMTGMMKIVKHVKRLFKRPPGQKVDPLEPEEEFIEDWSYISEFIEKERQQSSKDHSFIRFLKEHTSVSTPTVELRKIVEEQKSFTPIQEKQEREYILPVTSPFDQEMKIKKILQLVRPSLTVPEMGGGSITPDWHYVTKFIEKEREEMSKHLSAILKVEKVSVYKPKQIVEILQNRTDTTSVLKKVENIKTTLKISKILSSEPEQRQASSEAKEESAQEIPTLSTSGSSKMSKHVTRHVETTDRHTDMSKDIRVNTSAATFTVEPSDTYPKASSISAIYFPKPYTVEVTTYDLRRHIYEFIRREQFHTAKTMWWRAKSETYFIPSSTPKFLMGQSAVRRSTYSTTTTKASTEPVQFLHQVKLKKNRDKYSTKMQATIETPKLSELTYSKWKYIYEFIQRERTELTKENKVWLRHNAQKIIRDKNRLISSNSNKHTENKVRLNIKIIPSVESTHKPGIITNPPKNETSTEELVDFKTDALQQTSLTKATIKEVLSDVEQISSTLKEPLFETTDSSGEKLKKPSLIPVKKTISSLTATASTDINRISLNPPASDENVGKGNGFKAVPGAYSKISGEAPSLMPVKHNISSSNAATSSDIDRISVSSPANDVDAEKGHGFKTAPGVYSNMSGQAPSLIPIKHNISSLNATTSPDIDRISVNSPVSGVDVENGHGFKVPEIYSNISVRSKVEHYKTTHIPVLIDENQTSQTSRNISKLIKLHEAVSGKNVVQQKSQLEDVGQNTKTNRTRPYSFPMVQNFPTTNEEKNQKIPEGNNSGYTSKARKNENNDTENSSIRESFLKSRNYFERRSAPVTSELFRRFGSTNIPIPRIQLPPGTSSTVDNKEVTRGNVMDRISRWKSSEALDQKQTALSNTLKSSTKYLSTENVSGRDVFRTSATGTSTKYLSSENIPSHDVSEKVIRGSLVVGTSTYDSEDLDQKGVQLRSSTRYLSSENIPGQNTAERKFIRRSLGVGTSRYDSEDLDQKGVELRSSTRYLSSENIPAQNMAEQKFIRNSLDVGTSRYDSEGLDQKGVDLRSTTRYLSSENIPNQDMAEEKVIRRSLVIGTSRYGSEGLDPKSVELRSSTRYLSSENIPSQDLEKQTVIRRSLIAGRSRYESEDLDQKNMELSNKLKSSIKYLSSENISGRNLADQSVVRRSLGAGISSYRSEELKSSTRYLSSENISGQDVADQDVAEDVDQKNIEHTNRYKSSADRDVLDQKVIRRSPFASKYASQDLDRKNMELGYKLRSSIKYLSSENVSSSRDTMDQPVIRRTVVSGTEDSLTAYPTKESQAIRRSFPSEGTLAVKKVDAEKVDTVDSRSRTIHQTVLRRSFLSNTSSPKDEEASKPADNQDRTYKKMFRKSFPIANWEKDQAMTTHKEESSEDFRYKSLRPVYKTAYSTTTTGGVDIEGTNYSLSTKLKVEKDLPENASTAKDEEVPEHDASQSATNRKMCRRDFVADDWKKRQTTRRSFLEGTSFQQNEEMSENFRNKSLKPIYRSTAPTTDTATSLVVTTEPPVHKSFTITDWKTSQQTFGNVESTKTDYHESSTTKLVSSEEASENTVVQGVIDDKLLRKGFGVGNWKQEQVVVRRSFPGSLSEKTEEISEDFRNKSLNAVNKNISVEVRCPSSVPSDWKEDQVVLRRSFPTFEGTGDHATGVIEEKRFSGGKWTQERKSTSNIENLLSKSVKKEVVETRRTFSGTSTWKSSDDLRDSNNTRDLVTKLETRSTQSGSSVRRSYTENLSLWQSRVDSSNHEAKNKFQRYSLNLEERTAQLTTPRMERLNLPDMENDKEGRM